MRLLLDALILSHLSYALPVWGPPLSQQSLHCLKCIRNWAVQMTRGLSKFDYVSQYYPQLNWSPVKKLTLYLIAVLLSNVLAIPPGQMYLFVTSDPVWSLPFS